jgi:hypothetical protein
MKKLLFLFAFMLAAAFASVAQDVEITPFAGYTFGDKFPISGGEAKIGGGLNYGGRLAFVANEHMAVDLTYSRVDATGSAHSIYLDDDKNNKSGPISTNYFMVGASRLFPLSDEVVLFMGMDLGGVFMLAHNSDFKSSTTFAGGVNGGVKYFFNDRLGLRGQATLNFPVTSMSYGYWWDPTTEGNAGATSNVPLLQFGFSAGLIYRISLKSNKLNLKHIQCSITKN